MSTFTLVFIFIGTVIGLWIGVGLIHLINNLRKREFLTRNGWASVLKETEPNRLQEIFIKETDSGTVSTNDLQEAYEWELKNQ